MKKFFVLIPFAFILVNCKKKDSSSSQTIHGQVYNLCTDSGMANITVYLSTSGAALNPATTLSAVSDAGGNFSFINAQIHSNNEYEYSLYIPSKSGIGGVDVGFDGGGWVLDKNKLDVPFVLDVVPHFFNLCHTSNITSLITSPDSFFVSFEQKKISTSSISSNYTYTLGTSSYGYPPGYSHCFQNYIMGLWNITINKWKSGVHTITYDSIYVGYGSTETYTINW